MARITRRRGRIQLHLDDAERAALLEIVDELEPKIGSGLRTTPRAYEDQALQAEYDRWVRPDIERNRESDIAVVRDVLTSGELSSVLSEGSAYAWLRATNHLRLVAGEVLGLENDGWESDADRLKMQREFGMMMALGWLQEELIAALES